MYCNNNTLFGSIACGVHQNVWIRETEAKKKKPNMMIWNVFCGDLLQI